MRRRPYNGTPEFGLVSPSPRRFTPLSPVRFSSPVVLRMEDRRTFHPAGPRMRPAGSVLRGDSRWVARPTRLFSDVSARVGFAVPKRVAICVRRKQRKEVLHALNFHGKGSGGVSRRRRRTEFSNVDC